jgi:Protein of unknown function (DUF1161)
MTHRLAARCCALTTLQVASVLLAAGAHAQANPCDQLKAVLAARIDASGVRGYTLETVPAGTPVPRGAKVIGTCEAGASKILYRRWGATQPSSDRPLQAAPAPATSPAPRPASPSNEAASAVAPPRGHASEVETGRGVDHAVAEPQQIPPDKAAVTKVPPARQASGFMAEHWRWIGALAFVLIAASIWVWHAHRSAYDEAGLPRGPRL